MEAHQRTVYNIAYRMVRNREAALDLVQEAFLEAFAHLDSFSPGRPFAPWLYRIVHNRSLNHLKRASHPSAPKTLDTELRAPGPSPEALADKSDMAANLRKEVNRLPVKLRGVFILRYLENMTVTEVADILESPINTVKTHLFRARRLLRERLEKFL